MTDAARIRRLELAVAMLGLTAAVSALIVMLDAIRFHTTALVLAITGLRFGDVHIEGVVILALGGVSAAAVALAGWTAVRQLVCQRRYIRRLHCLEHKSIDGRDVVIVRGPASVAFCGGFLRPRIFVSDATMERLSPEELRAVVAHEGHHADRRDPLRLLIGSALTSSLRPIPAVSSLGRRQAALAELAADAAAVRSLGGPGPLAGALLAFDEDGDSTVAVAPERVDHLLGEASPEGMSRVVLTLTGLALGTLSSVALMLMLLPDHPAFPVSSLPFCMVAISFIASPAWLATRRVSQALRPSA